ncbi:hypothetical protein K0U07_04255 [bacterium]|nr:hypothetical protein [bacterium]
MALQYLEKDVFFVEKLVSIYQMDKEKRDPVKVHETFVEDLFSSLRLLEEETRFYGQLCSDIAFDQLYLGVLQRKDFLQGRQNQLSWTKKEESDRIIWQLDRAVEMNAYDLHAFVSAMEGDDYKLEENGGERPYLYFSNVEVSPYFEGAFDTYRVNFKIIQKRNK